MSAAWISRTRSGFMACWPLGFFAALLFFEVLPLAAWWLDPDLPDFCDRACAMPDISSARPKHSAVMRSRWFTEHLSRWPEPQILFSEATRYKPQRRKASSVSWKPGR